MFRPRHQVLAALAALTLACQSELELDEIDESHSANSDCTQAEIDDAEPVELVFADRWQALGDPTADPFGSHRPATLVCPSGGWGDEFGALEVRTAQCNYLSVEQPLAAKLAVGDTLRLQVWWQNLIALEPATAHLALLVDGELLWELEVEIPGPSSARQFEFPSPVSAEAGATVNFHLHNHGQNTWTLATLERVESAGPVCD